MRELPEYAVPLPTASRPIDYAKYRVCVQPRSSLIPIREPRPMR